MYKKSDAMENKNKRLISYSIIGSLLLIFAFYSNTIMYADAVSVSNVTFTGGTTTQDISYDKTAQGSNTATAYVIGLNAGQAYVWKVTNTTINFNVTLTGSSGARAIEYNEDNSFVYAVANDKIYKISNTGGNAGSLASGTANIIQELFYDDTNNILYYCTNDGYGTINTVSLSLSNLYSDPQTNAVLGCDFDIINGYAVLAGNDIGSTFNCELITVSLTTNTQVGCYNNGASAPFYSVCVDNANATNTFYWGLSSSDSIARKLTSGLSLSASVTVGTTPRNCSINLDDTGRRLYVANEGSDTISIVDIDANAVLSSPSVCDTVADRRIDTKRLEATTYTFVTCNANVNSIVVDDTVSEFIPPSTPETIFCEQPENFNLLRCVLERGDTTPLVGASELIGESSNTIVCQLGLIACTDFVPNDPDTKTNGVGYMVLFVGLGIMIGIFWVASRGDLGSIPTFLWFIATLSIIGIMVSFDLIDATILIIAIIAIVALATAKVKGVFGSSGLFAGDT
jgi:YVTN family beta-propeller protein